MVNPDHSVMFVKLRAFILSLLPDIEVVQGLGNGVPMPSTPFICITPIGQKRLSTNKPAFNGIDTKAVMMPTQYNIQIDCYGPDSSDWATTIAAMFRDPYGCDMLAPDCQPLYCGEPAQAALINAELNYEQRWTFPAMLQFNPIVTVPQQYADKVDLLLVSVDAVFPP